MSLNVLVIPEDFRKDQYILDPIIRRMFAELGKRNARIRICLDPLLGGIGQALKWQNIASIIRMYPVVQLFLLIVDRDGNAGRRSSLDNLEKNALETFGPAKCLLAEHAWQEIEVWALAGQKLPGDWNWREIRIENHPKERFFEPWAKQRGLLSEPGQGRTTLGKEAALNYARVRTLCQEDVQSLESRISDWLETVE